MNTSIIITGYWNTMGAIALAIVCCCSGCHKSAPRRPATQPADVGVSDPQSLVERWDMVRHTLGYPCPVAKRDRLIRSDIQEGLIQGQKRYVYGGGRNNISIAIDPVSNSYLQCIDNATSALKYGRNAPMYDSPEEPKWEGGKAVKVADEVLKGMLGETVAREYRLCRAEYGPSGQERNKYYGGRWFVVFQRVDANNIPFENDFASIMLGEDVGPFILTVNYGSVISGPQKPQLTSAEAADRAVEWLPKERHCPAIWICENYQQDYVSENYLTMRLAYVNPNKILESHEYEAVTQPKQRDVKLAWIVVDHIKQKGTNIPRGHGFGVEVWIDADNGEFLGGILK